jgi:deazaflavin-dependent oxidoreductase (nitroreductase family)
MSLMMCTRIARSLRSRCKTPGIADRYQRPGWFTTHVFNRAVAALTRAGVSVAGSRILEVRGRKTGEPRRTPVNPLTYDGARYLVAPRGHTQWVRNLRVQGEGRLLLGRRAEPFAAVELPDEDSGDDELRRIAPDHPVFRIAPLTRRSKSPAE